MKINKILYLDITIFFITICNFLYIIFSKREPCYNLLYTMPIAYFLAYIIGYRQKHGLKSIFLNSFYIICFFRYQVLPFFIVYSGGNYYGRSPLFPQIDSFLIAYILMIYELIISSIFIFFIFSKIKVKNENDKLNVDIKNKNILSLFLVIAITLIVFDENARSLFNFIIPNILTKDISSYSVISSLIAYYVYAIKQIFFIYMISILSSSNRSVKLGEKSYKFTMSTTFLLLNVIIYMGLNRSDFLIPALASFYIFSKFYKKASKYIFFILLLLLFVIIVLITNTREVRLISKGEDIILDITDFLQVYFGGIYNVAIAVETKEFFPKGINLTNLLYDLFRPIPFFKFIFKDSNLVLSSVYYNERMFMTSFRSQIIPIIGQGYYYFGILFSPIFSLTLIYIANLFYKIIVSKKNSLMVYFLSLQSIRLGFMMGQSMSIQINDLTFNLAIPVILITILSNKIRI